MDAEPSDRPERTRHDWFVNQFERDGTGWLYRRWKTGPGYRVTDAEKEAFVATFDRTRRRLRWITLGVFAAALMAWLLFAPSRRAPPFFWFYMGLFGPRLVIDHVAGRAPLRALRQRTPVAPALSKMERRRLSLARVSFELVFGAAVAAAIVLAMIVTEGGLDSWGGRGWIAIFAAFLLWAAILGLRKWQVVRADQVASSLT